MSFQRFLKIIKIEMSEIFENHQNWDFKDFLFQVLKIVKIEFLEIFFSIFKSRQNWFFLLLLILTFFFFSASGLMIASRYPILAVDFHVCRHKRSLWQKPICYGIIMAKVELFGGKVGFLANLHNVAYQGTVGVF